MAPRTLFLAAFLGAAALANAEEADLVGDTSSGSGSGEPGSGSGVEPPSPPPSTVSFTMQSTNSVDYFTAQRITSIKTSMAALVSVPVSDVSLELSASTRRRLADTTILAWTILAASVADAQSIATTISTTTSADGWTAVYPGWGDTISSVSDPTISTPGSDDDDGGSNAVALGCGLGLGLGLPIVAVGGYFGYQKMSGGKFQSAEPGALQLTGAAHQS